MHHLFPLVAVLENLYIIQQSTQLSNNRQPLPWLCEIFVKCRCIPRKFRIPFSVTQRSLLKSAPLRYRERCRCPLTNVGTFRTLHQNLTQNHQQSHQRRRVYTVTKWCLLFSNLYPSSYKLRMIEFNLTTCSQGKLKYLELSY